MPASSTARVQRFSRRCSARQLRRRARRDLPAPGHRRALQGQPHRGAASAREALPGAARLRAAQGHGAENPRALQRGPGRCPRQAGQAGDAGVQPARRPRGRWPCGDRRVGARPSHRRANALLLSPRRQRGVWRARPQTQGRTSQRHAPGGRAARWPTRPSPSSTTSRSTTPPAAGSRARATRSPRSPSASAPPTPVPSAPAEVPEVSDEPAWYQHWYVWTAVGVAAAAGGGATYYFLSRPKTGTLPLTVSFQ